MQLQHCKDALLLSTAHIIRILILLENTGLVSIVMLMTLNYISQQNQMKLRNYLS